MARVHVNPETGEVGKCNAVSSKCPFGGESGNENHFANMAEGRIGAEKIMVAKNGNGISGIKKRFDFDKYQEFNDNNWLPVKAAVQGFLETQGNNGRQWKIEPSKDPHTNPYAIIIKSVGAPDEGHISLSGGQENDSIGISPGYEIESKRGAIFVRPFVEMNFDKCDTEAMEKYGLTRSHEGNKFFAAGYSSLRDEIPDSNSLKNLLDGLTRGHQGYTETGKKNTVAMGTTGENTTIGKLSDNAKMGMLNYIKEKAQQPSEKLEITY